MAASIKGDALPEKLCAVVAWLRMSETPITVPSAVIFVMAMALFVMGGMTILMACGSTTENSACVCDSPVERAASHCPSWVAVMPAHVNSSAKAASTTDNTSSNTQ